MTILDALSVVSKGRTQAPWPPPPIVRPVMAAVRRRYHAMRRIDRPPLDQPANAVGLFTLSDLLVLAKCAYYPLPARAIQWIAQTPKEQRRRRLRFDRRIESAVAEVMVAELPAAVAYLRGTA